MTPDVGTEAALLVAVARQQVAPAAADRLASHLETPVDWAALLELARGNGMRPLLLRELRDRGPARVPDAVLTRLETAQARIATRNLFMAHEVGSLLGQLDDHGIPALTFKGPTQAQLAFSEIGMREFSDLDILVPEHALADAIDVLRANDYRVVEEFDIGQRVMRHRQTSLPVDLHHSIMPLQYPFSWPFDRLWARRTRIEIGGTAAVRTLDPADLVLLIAVHGTKHSWFRLEWLVSFCRLADREGTDIQRIRTEARRIGCHRMLLLGFALAQSILDYAPPEPVRRAIAADSTVERIADQLEQTAVLRNVDYATDYEFHRHRYHRQWRLMPDRRSKLRYGLRIRGSYLANEIARFEHTTGLVPRRYVVGPIRRLHSMYARLRDRV